MGVEFTNKKGGGSNMPKKKKSDFKKYLEEFLTRSVGIVTASLSKVNVVGMVKNLLNIKAKLRKYISSLVLITAGVIVLMLGVSSYLTSLFPVLNNGFSEMIVGAVLIIISIIVYKG